MQNSLDTLFCVRDSYPKAKIIKVTTQTQWNIIKSDISIVAKFTDEIDAITLCTALNSIYAGDNNE